MKNILVIIHLIAFFSCCKNTSTNQNSLPELTDFSIDTLVDKPLHTDLSKVWNEFRKEYDKDGIIDTAIYYYFYFYSYDNDSLVGVSFKNCNDKYFETECKGMTNIDGYNIAVLDPENIGKDFYNRNLLIQVDFSKLKCFEDKRKKGALTGFSYRIKNNRIFHFWEDYLNEKTQ